MSTLAFDPVHFSRLFDIEDRHFWFRARNQVIAALARRSSPRAARVLEIGCGTGNALRALIAACPGAQVVGVDLFAEGLRHARRRVDSPLVQADANALPFRCGFDLIGCFDVLEHVSADDAVLRELHRRLAHGGALLVTVPAHASLWSYFDDASCHVRRYGPSELTGKLREAGFRVEFVSQYMASLFAPIWLGRRLSLLLHGNRKPTHDQANRMAETDIAVVPLANDLLSRLLALEARWIGRGHTLPIGTSLVALARKA